MGVADYECVGEHDVDFSLQWATVVGFCAPILSFVFPQWVLEIQIEFKVSVYYITC